MARSVRKSHIKTVSSNDPVKNVELIGLMLIEHTLPILERCQELICRR